MLWLAGIYNLIFGAWVVMYPRALWTFVGQAPPRPIAVWQCLGMVVGVYGIGYVCAAYAPMRHWPIVLVGLIGKVLGPIGYVLAARNGELPWRFGYLNIANDVIWWIPFSLILSRAWYRSHVSPHRWFE